MAYYNLGPKKTRTRKHKSGLRMAKGLAFRKAKRYKLSGLSGHGMGSYLKCIAAGAIGGLLGAWGLKKIKSK